MEQILLEINNYINSIGKDTNDYREALTILDKICDYIRSLDVDLSIDNYIELINNNPLFNKLILVIVDNNMELIKRNKIDLKFNDNILLQLIDAYCSLNNIDYEFDTDYEEDKNTSLEALPSYMREINKERTLLTREEEKELFKRLKNNDEEARNIIIEKNLRLVMAIANRYVNHGLDLLDLIQEGNIGLMKAVEKFDEDKGYKFSTFAVWWIRQAITRAIHNLGNTVRIPVHTGVFINKINAIRGKFSETEGREPTAVELGNILNVSPEYIEKHFKYMKRFISLESPVKDEDSSEISFFIKDDKVNVEDETIDNSLSQLIKEIIEGMNLSEREKEIIVYRLGFGDSERLTLEELAEKWGTSRERIRQLEKKVLIKFRNPKYLRMLAPYYGDDIDIESIAKNAYIGSASNMHQRKSFKSHFKNYTKEEVLLALTLLSKEEVDVYNNYFSVNSPVSTEVIKNFSYVSKRIRQILNNNSKLTNFYYFKSYSLESITYSINQLSEEERQLLYSVYGKDLTSVIDLFSLSETDYKNLYHIMIDKLSDLLLKNKHDYSIEQKTIYTLYKETHSLVNFAISLLSEEDQEIIKARFGTNLTKIKSLSIEEYYLEEQFMKSTYKKLMSKIEGVKQLASFLTYLEIENETDYLKLSTLLPTFLSKEELDLLHKYYGLDYKKLLIIDKLSIKDLKKLLDLMNKLSEFLSQEKQNNKSEKGIKIKPLYDYFENYTKNEVNVIVNTLPEKDLFVIRKRYSDNLASTIPNQLLNSEEQSLFHHTIIIKIERRLQKLQKLNSLLDFFGKYYSRITKESIDKLSASDYLLLSKYYGDDLNLEFDYKVLNEEELSKLWESVNKLLELLKEKQNNKTEKIIKIKSLYDYFENYTKNEVNVIIKTLPEKDLLIIRKRYGNDLASTIPNETLNNEEQRLFHYTIIPKIERRLQKMQKLNFLLNFFGSYHSKIMKECINKLSASDSELLHKYYGKNLNLEFDYKALNEEELSKLWSIVNELLQILKSNNNKKLEKEEVTVTTPTLNEITNNSDVFEVIDLLRDEDFNVSFDLKDIVITILKFYGINGKRYSTKEISEFLNISELEVINIVKKVLKIYQKRFNNGIVSLQDALEKDFNDTVISNFMKKQTVYEILPNLNTIELLVFSLKSGYVNDLVYTIDEISAFLNISPLEVINVIKEVLNKYKDYVNSQIDMATELILKRERLLENK